jgi:hypothetical protein
MQTLKDKLICISCLVLFVSCIMTTSIVMFNVWLTKYDPSHHICIDPAHIVCDGECLCDGMECQNAEYR